MVLLTAFALASAATAPVPARPGAAVTATASARVLPAARVRQGEPMVSREPAMQVTRKRNGEILVEYT